MSYNATLRYSVKLTFSQFARVYEAPPEMKNMLTYSLLCLLSTENGCLKVVIGVLEREKSRREP